MTTSLGGPREGLCVSRSWLRYSHRTDEPLPEDSRDEQRHGTRPWADFIADMEKLGATRPTYDWFDVPDPSGFVRRYRVVDEGYLP